MGTRHLICVYHNGSWVLIQYGQWDGYPPGQGNQILRFLHRADNPIARLKAGLAHTYQPSEEELRQIDEDAAALRELYESRGENDRALQTLYELKPSLSRETGARILDLVADTATAENPLPVEIEKGDARTIEWFYVIDLGKEVLEVYADWWPSSGNVQGEDQGRFAGLDFGGVPELVRTYPLGELPGEFEYFFRKEQFLGDGVGGEEEEDDE